MQGRYDQIFNKKKFIHNIASSLAMIWLNVVEFLIRIYESA